MYFQDEPMQPGDENVEETPAEETTEEPQA